MGGGFLRKLKGVGLRAQYRLACQLTVMEKEKVKYAQRGQQQIKVMMKVCVPLFISSDLLSKWN